MKQVCAVFGECLVANWGIPIAAFADAQANPDKISGKMTSGNCTCCIVINCPSW